MKRPTGRAFYTQSPVETFLDELRVALPILNEAGKRALSILPAWLRSSLLLLAAVLVFLVSDVVTISFCTDPAFARPAFDAFTREVYPTPGSSLCSLWRSTGPFPELVMILAAVLGVWLRRRGPSKYLLSRALTHACTFIAILFIAILVVTLSLALFIFRDLDPL